MNTPVLTMKTITMRVSCVHLYLHNILSYLVLSNKTYDYTLDVNIEVEYNKKDIVIRLLFISTYYHMRQIS